MAGVAGHPGLVALTGDADGVSFVFVAVFVQLAILRAPGRWWRSPVTQMG